NATPYPGAHRPRFVSPRSHADFNARVLRQASVASVHQARAAHVTELHFPLPTDGDAATHARAVVEGAIHGAYENDFYQAHDDDAPPALARLTICAPAPHGELRAGLERGRIVAESV